MAAWWRGPSTRSEDSAHRPARRVPRLGLLLRAPERRLSTLGRLPSPQQLASGLRLSLRPPQGRGFPPPPNGMCGGWWGRRRISRAAAAACSSSRPSSRTTTPSTTSPRSCRRARAGRARPGLRGLVNPQLRVAAYHPLARSVAMRAPFAAMHIFLDDDELYIEGTAYRLARRPLRRHEGPKRGCGWC